MHPDAKIQQFAGSLERLRWRSSDRFVACCPAHPDRNPSLSISLGERGLLVKCWAGCALDEILTPLGLSARDLFYDADADPRERQRIQRTPRAARLDWRCQASRLEDHTLTLWLRAERVLTAATGLDIGAWDDAELNASLAAVAKAYVDLGRADLLTDVAFHLRCRGLEEEAKRRAHAA